MAGTRDIDVGPAPVPAQYTPPAVTLSADGYREDAHAVVIGINTYQDTRIPNLQFARADAEAMCAVLTDPAIGRFKPENVVLLVDADATERKIRSAIGTQLPRRAGKEHTVIVYYAGHGAPVIDPSAASADGMEKYLIPYDAAADDLRSTAISMTDVQRFFGWIDAHQVIFFLDSCYSGGAAGGRSFEMPGFSARALLSDEFLQGMAADGRFVVTACATSEVSLETADVGHGLFTYHLVKGLQGAADADRDGMVTMDELYEYVYRNVNAQARALGGSMNPLRKGEVRGSVYLTQYETEAQRDAKAAAARAAAAQAAGDEAGAEQAWQQVVALVPDDAAATAALAAIAAHRAARDQARAAGTQQAQAILLQHRRSGALPVRLFAQATDLLDRDPASLSADERETRSYVDSLVAGEITPAQYVHLVSLLTGAATAAPMPGATVPNVVVPNPTLPNTTPPNVPTPNAAVPRAPAPSIVVPDATPSVAVPRRGPSATEVAAVCARYAIGDFVLRAAASPKRLAGAMAAVGLTREDDVIAILDWTLRGNGSDAIVITTTGVRWYGESNANGAWQGLEWAALAEAHITALRVADTDGVTASPTGSFTAIDFGDLRRVVMLDAVPHATVARMLRELQRLVRREPLRFATFAAGLTAICGLFGASRYWVGAEIDVKQAATVRRALQVPDGVDIVAYAESDLFFVSTSGIAVCTDGLRYQAEASSAGQMLLPWARLGSARPPRAEQSVVKVLGEPAEAIKAPGVGLTDAQLESMLGALQWLARTWSTSPGSESSPLAMPFPLPA